MAEAQLFLPVKTLAYLLMTKAHKQCHKWAKEILYQAGPWYGSGEVLL